jgi:hypothetical protein
MGKVLPRLEEKIFGQYSVDNDLLVNTDNVERGDIKNRTCIWIMVNDPWGKPAYEQYPCKVPSAQRNNDSLFSNDKKNSDDKACEGRFPD